MKIKTMWRLRLPLSFQARKLIHFDTNSMAVSTFDEDNTAFEPNTSQVRIKLIIMNVNNQLNVINCQNFSSSLKQRLSRTNKESERKKERIRVIDFRSDNKSRPIDRTLYYANNGSPLCTTCIGIEWRSPSSFSVWFGWLDNIYSKFVASLSLSFTLWTHIEFVSYVYVQVYMPPVQMDKSIEYQLLHEVSIHSIDFIIKSMWRMTRSISW